MTSRIVSIQVGLPGRQDVPGEKPWTTGYGKRAVHAPVRVRRENLEGDGQGNREVHGGLDQAVLAYGADHYERWSEEIGEALSFGAFAENLTVSGLTENDVCVGDEWAADDVVFRVSQPRGPCGNISRFHRRRDLTKRVGETGRTGWYLRVLEEGVIEAGDEVRLVKRLHPAWTVARANAVKYAPTIDREAAAELLTLPELGLGFRKSLTKRIGTGSA